MPTLETYPTSGIPSPTPASGTPTAIAEATATPPQEECFYDAPVCGGGISNSESECSFSCGMGPVTQLSCGTAAIGQCATKTVNHRMECDCVDGGRDTPQWKCVHKYSGTTETFTCYGL